MSYKLLASGGVQRMEDGTFIPADEGNLDWQKYQAFLEAGGVPLPADPALCPDNGASLVRDELRRQIELQIATLPVDLQAVLRNMMKLIDVEV